MIAVLALSSFLHASIPPFDSFHHPVHQSPRETIYELDARLLFLRAMSDPEPTMAAASSSPSLPAVDSSALTYAFLVHSQKTLTQNLPPRVDNKLLARQKRRRTRYVVDRILFHRSAWSKSTSRQPRAVNASSGTPPPPKRRRPKQLTPGQSSAV